MRIAGTRVSELPPKVDIAPSAKATVEPAASFVRGATQTMLPQDGAAKLDALIDQLGARAKRGEKVALLWDADFTLLDTRPRMLATAQAFGCAGATLAQMKGTPSETAAALGLDAKAFYAFWDTFYWAEDKFSLDTEISAVAERARRAQDLGITNVVITGRTEDLREATLGQMLRLGIAPASVWLKRDADQRTPEMKREVMLALQAQGYHLGGFVTDSPDEILGAKIPGMACFLAKVVGVDRDTSGLSADVSVLDTSVQPSIADRTAQRLALQFPASGKPVSLEGRIAALCAKWPLHARVVADIRFSFDGKQEKSRTVLNLSIGTLDDAGKAALLADYLATMGTSTVSFPLREKATHLRVRLGRDSVDFSSRGFVRDTYRLPSAGSSRLETTLQLDDGESKRLSGYIARAEAQADKILGTFTMGDGPERVNGKLNDNRPQAGGRHNCTSWVCMAPIGKNGEQLRELAGEPATFEVHDSPGWWTMFLAGASPSTRAQTVVYWSDAPISPSQKLDWNFSPVSSAADIVRVELQSLITSPRASDAIRDFARAKLEQLRDAAAEKLAEIDTWISETWRRI